LPGQSHRYYQDQRSLTDGHLLASILIQTNKALISIEPSFISE
jgi:hypothetical protein